ncbi:MAG: AzlD domain-containing protein [Cyanobacteria bacterium J06627_3]
MANEAMLLAGMTLVTFLIRYPLLAMSGRLTLQPGLLQALNYVPPAVLTAIIAPTVLMAGDSLWLGADNPRLMGSLAAIGIGFWQKNLLLTILAGMGVFLFWQGILG